MEHPSADKQFKATMFLADAANMADGKINVLGAFWTVTGPGPSQFVIVANFDVPWEKANQRQQFRIELIDLDGNSVMPVGFDEPLAFDGHFEAGRPPGVRPGTFLPVQLILPSPGFVQFPPGGQFEFRLSIGDQTHEGWRLPFSTRAVMELPQAA